MTFRKENNRVDGRRCDIVWLPSDYIETAVVANEARDEMLLRLEWMTLQPKIVLDIGCGLGELSLELQNRYPDAVLLSVDRDFGMIHYATQHTSVAHSICADGMRLPLQDQSLDMVFANLVLPWCADLQRTLAEWQRILKPNGLMMMTLFGPDTLSELDGLIDAAYLPMRIDMHDVGDLLLQLGLIDPVLDVDRYTLSYRDPQKLVDELKSTGMITADIDAEFMIAQLPKTDDGEWLITYEVIHALAFTKTDDASAASEDGIVRIPLSRLRHSLAKK
jgi:malonyl-CoA O-methyltransferase